MINAEIKEAFLEASGETETHRLNPVVGAAKERHLAKIEEAESKGPASVGLSTGVGANRSHLAYFEHGLPERHRDGDGSEFLVSELEINPIFSRHVDRYLSGTMYDFVESLKLRLYQLRVQFGDIVTKIVE